MKGKSVTTIDNQIRRFEESDKEDHDDEGMILLQKQNFTFIRYFWWQNDPIYRTFYEQYLVSQYLLLAFPKLEYK